MSASVQIMVGDCRDTLKALPEASVDSVVTDPPYGLEFMGKEWDKGVPGVDVWAEVLRVLKPGGWLLAFAGTRTQHRMAVAIEDAGFEIRDMIGWAYGSGFPKSKNLDGDRQGWGTALKPAWEPITVARKALIGTVAANVQAHGTGALNIDGCRVPTTDDLNGGAYAENGRRGVSQSLRQGSGMNQPGKTVGSDFIQPQGRWPANIIHDGSDEVLACFPDSNGQQGFVGQRNGARDSVNCYGDWGARPDTPPRGDTGSAARFFYCAKASKADRDHGLEHMDEQAFVQFQTANGTSGKASSLSEGRDTRRKNTHPTVKPTDLMRYLCRLVTPPGGTVLDPFMGSGSTGRGAVMEGLGFIGVDLSAEYADMARARIAGAEREVAAALDEKIKASRQAEMFP